MLVKLKNRIIIAIFLTINIALFFSCDNTNTPVPIEPSSIDYGYFPIDTGKWITYDVIEIDIDAAINKFDTIRYQLKEYFESEFQDNTGNNSIRIERYVRNSNTLPWNIKNVWTASLLKTSAQKVEDNIRYVKLVFPVKLDLSWNGNIYNSDSDDSEDNYTITVLDSSENVNTFLFDSVLTVTQADKQSLIDRIYKIEKYAKNIGLIYKKEIDIYSDTVDPNTDIMDRITYGTIYEQTISDYGNNK